MPAEQDTRSDQALVDAANRGDAAAFAALYRLYRDWVFSLARRLTGDESLALDVTQEVFTYFLRQFPGFVLTAKLKTYLYPLVRHSAISMQQKERRSRSPCLPPESQMLDTDPDAETRQSIAQAVGDLPPGQREVVHLRFADDLSLAEIAAALELPLGTVKSRLHHALAALREDSRTRNQRLD